MKSATRPTQRPAPRIANCGQRLLSMAPGPRVTWTECYNIILLFHFEKPRQGMAKQTSQGYEVAKKESRAGIGLRTHMAS